MTKSQAMSLCEKIRAGMGQLADLLAEFHENHGWLALGYSTWKECCEKEFQHPAWWAKRQLKVAAIRKSLPAPPTKDNDSEGCQKVRMRPHITPQSDSNDNDSEGCQKVRMRPHITPQSDSNDNDSEGCQKVRMRPHITPQSDRAILELGKVPEADRPEVLAAATAGGKPPTARSIKEAAAVVSPPTEPTGGGRPRVDHPAFAKLESKIGEAMRAADAIHRNSPNDDRHNDVIRNLKAAIHCVAAWRKGIR
jgi:hypothetical protein